MWKWRGFINGSSYYNLIKNRTEKDNSGETSSGWEKKKKKAGYSKIKEATEKVLTFPTIILVTSLCLLRIL